MSSRYAAATALMAVTFVSSCTAGTATVDVDGTSSPSSTTTVATATQAASSAVVQGGEDVLSTTVARQAPAVATCPAGTDPDRRGPVDQARPRRGFPVTAALDRQSGRVIAIAGSRTWALDVCTNTWAPMSYPESLAAVPPILVYDVDSDLVVAIQRTVHTYDVDTDTWTRNANAPTALADKFNVRGIYDPVSGLIVVRDTLSSEMWAYNVDTDVWTPLRQGTLSPPGRDQAPDTALANTVYGQVHAYDAGTDRILLYLTDNHSGPGVWEGMGTEMTWAYDLRAGEWTIEDTVTPELNFGWIVGPGKTTYDETARATLVVADGVVAGYDAGSNEWGLLWENSSGPTVFGTRTGPHNRVDHAIVYDPTNQRVIVIGGSARMLEEDPFWVPMDDVWAFDTDTGTWLEILASSAP